MGMGMRVLLGHVSARLIQGYRDSAQSVTAGGEDIGSGNLIYTLSRASCSGNHGPVTVICCQLPCGAFTEFTTSPRPFCQ
jgi:hypothetical protein